MVETIEHSIADLQNYVEAKGKPVVGYVFHTNLDPVLFEGVKQDTETFPGLIFVTTEELNKQVDKFHDRDTTKAESEKANENPDADPALAPDETITKPIDDTNPDVQLHERPAEEGTADGITGVQEQQEHQPNQEQQPLNSETIETPHGQEPSENPPENPEHQNDTENPPA